MRARIGGGFFLLGVVLLTVDPLAGQPGGGRSGRTGFGNFGQPGATPAAPAAPPAAYAVQPGGQPTAAPTPPGGPTRFQYQPGGGPPGGFSRGGGMDPEAQWQMMLKVTGGTDALDFSRIPPESRQFLRGMSERMGTMPLPESGVWNKSQFIDFATRNQEIVRAKMSGGQPPAFGTPGVMTMQPGMRPPGGGMSDEDATRRFREADKDQDGRLSWDEASSKSRENWQEIDVNQNRFLELDEYRAYIARRYGPGAQGGPPGGFPMVQPGGFPGQPGYDFRGTGEFNPGGRRDDKKAEDFSNVAIRYGKLPPGLPDWFAEYDTDKDGQVNMYEWRTVGGKATAEFRELDANGDGLIAPLELIRLTATKAETERLLAIQDGEAPQGSRGKGGSMGGGGYTGRGGFPGGGPPMTGKTGGDARQPEARPSREEKRDEKAAGNRGPWGSGGKK